MSPTPQARRLARWIFEQNQNGVSYREIATDFNFIQGDGSPVVKAGTICRIAKSGGAWLPKRDDILIVLGLKNPPKPKEKIPAWMRRIKKKIAGMAKDTQKAVLRN